MSARFTTLSLVVVILTVLCALSLSSAASIRERSPAGAENLNIGFEARQASTSEEGYDEDSEEGDDDQAAQQSYLKEQQYDESSVEESEEENDDADEDYESNSRRRRAVKSSAEQVSVEAASHVTTPASEDSIKNEKEEASTLVVAATPASPAISSPPKKSSVLILIRDTLKKVTNDLPTQQYASNALQYFQLFEHFLQETIEEVINGDDDDEDEEASTNKTEIEVVGEEAGTKAPETIQTAEAVEDIAHIAQVTEEQKKPLETSEPVAVSQTESAVAAEESNPTKVKFV